LFDFAMNFNKQFNLKLVMALQVGDKIPDYLGVDQNEKKIYSSNFKGKKLILYFYPKDNTPGCTSEACSFRDNYAELRRRNFEIIGISTDDILSHQKFILKNNLPFTLITDTDHRLGELFGTFKEKKRFGRKYFGIERTTFIIDENGIITHIIPQEEIDTKKHAQQILERVGGEEK
jgi:peroxiredoxin Q/BCP